MGRLRHDDRDEHPLSWAAEIQRALPTGLVGRQYEHPSGGECILASPVRVLNDYLI